MRSWKLFLLLPVIVCCHGEDGAIGPSGFNSLLSISNEAPGPNCTEGGIMVLAGLDTNSNNLLDENEVTSTSYICNGTNGKSSLTTVAVEPVGTNCPNGGTRINSGRDTNSNGLLDASEITATSFACNGDNGKMSLVTIIQEDPGMACSNGGLKINSGVDLNVNGTLDDAEISVIRFLCNGKSNDTEEQIRLKINYPLNNNAFDWFGTSSLTYQFAGVGLIDFDKRFFVGVDSIIFTSNPHSHGAAKAFVELYNATDNVSIANSELNSLFTFDNRSYIKSPNIYSSLPEKRIDLGVRVKSEVSGVTVTSGTPYLILYRRNY